MKQKIGNWTSTDLVTNRKSITKGLFSRIIVFYLAIALLTIPVAFAEDSYVVSQELSPEANDLGSFGKITTINLVENKQENLALLVRTSTPVPIQGRLTDNLGNAVTSQDIYICISESIQENCATDATDSNGMFNLDISFALEDPHSQHLLNIWIGTDKTGEQVVTNEAFFPAGGPQGDLVVNGSLNFTEDLRKIESGVRRVEIGGTTNMEAILAEVNESAIGAPVNGVLGIVTQATNGDSAGVRGTVDGVGYGVYGHSLGGIGIYGSSAVNYSGKFSGGLGVLVDGNLTVNGSATVSGSPVCTQDGSGCPSGTGEWLRDTSSPQYSYPTVLGNGTSVGMKIYESGFSPYLKVYQETPLGSTMIFGRSATGTGISGDTDTGIGIKGKANNALGYAGYFEGRVSIQGNTIITNLNVTNSTNLENVTITNLNVTETTNLQTLNVTNLTVEYLNATYIDGAGIWNPSPVNASNIYYDTGFVGIGAQNPKEPLHVNGSIVIARTSALMSNLYWEDGPEQWKYVGTGFGSAIKMSSKYDGRFSIFTAPNNTIGSDENATLSPRLVILNSGEVGIGTNFPVSKLDVDGNIRLGNEYDGYGTFSTDNTPSLNWHGFAMAANAIRDNDADQWRTINGSLDNLVFGTKSEPGNSFFAWWHEPAAGTDNASINFTRIMQLDSDGNLTLLTGSLDVNGSATVSGSPVCTEANGLCTGASGTVSGSGTVNQIAKWNGSSSLSDSVIYDDGSNVGIGTTSPVRDLTVDINDGQYLQGITQHGDSQAIQVANINATDGNSVTFSFASEDGSGTRYSGAMVGASFLNHSSQESILAFATREYAGAGGIVERMRIDQFGKVGIGTNSLTPIRGKLHISGVPDRYYAITTETDFDGRGIEIITQDFVHVDDGPPQGSAVTINLGNGTGDVYAEIQSFDEGKNSTNDIALQPKGGNVGIGTTSPDTKLSVSGDNAIVTIRHSGYGIGNGPAIDMEAHGSWGPGARIKASGVHSSEADLLFYTNPLREDTDGSGLTERMRISSVGNVGIGTTTPGEKLYVAGNINATGTICDSVGCIGGGGGPGLWNESGSDIYYDSGNVGIGTDSPRTKLEVVGGSIIASNNNWVGFIGESANDLSWNRPDIIMQRARGNLTSKSIVANNDVLNIYRVSGYDGSDYTYAADILFEVDGTPGLDDMPGRINFKTTPDGSNTTVTRMTIKSDGNVGIGTATPGEALEVAGNINAIGGDICIAGAKCLSTAGIGDVTDVFVGTGLLVAGSTGPQVTLDLNTVYVDANYINEGQANSITSNMVVNNSLTGADIAPDSVGASELTPGFESGSVYDSRFVNVEGDTMTGSLRVQTDLIVGSATSGVITSGRTDGDIIIQLG